MQRLDFVLVGSDEQGEGACYDVHTCASWVSTHIARRVKSEEVATTTTHIHMPGGRHHSIVATEIVKCICPTSCAMKLL